MTDILILQERVKNAVQLGESHFREFKSAWEGKPNEKRKGDTKTLCKYIGEALVAFANADGGELLIGVEDDGRITGIPHSELEIESLLSATKTQVYHDNVLPLIMATKIEVENNSILFFSVSKGTTEIYQLADGRCVRRRDKATVPIAFRQITIERQEAKSREYDRQFIDGATVNDLDISLTQAIADKYIKGISIERYLQQVGLAEYSTNCIRLRMAALLLFAKEIQKWHPRSQIRILKISGTELKSGSDYNAISDEIIFGSIFELIEKSWERLRPFLASGTTFNENAIFSQRFDYPEHVCKEALINAIVHRDYSIQNGIDIFIFTNRIEIKSPGALLSTLTIHDLEELQGAHESRNVYIAKVLRENQYVRELGEGMKRMFTLMRQNELQNPKLYSNSTWFSITFFHKSIFSKQEEQWLSLFDSFSLSPNQKKLVVLGINNKEISPEQIHKALGTDDLRLYNEEIKLLREAGIFESITTNSQALKQSKDKKVPKKQISRFKVKIPKNNE